MVFGGSQGTRKRPVDGLTARKMRFWQYQSPSTGLIPFLIQTIMVGYVQDSRTLTNNSNLNKSRIGKLIFETPASLTLF